MSWARYTILSDEGLSHWNGKDYHVVPVENIQLRSLYYFHLYYYKRIIVIQHGYTVQHGQNKGNTDLDM